MLADLAELGVRRAIWVGTCAAIGLGVRPGDLVSVRAARSSWTRHAGSGYAVTPRRALALRTCASSSGTGREAGRWRASTSWPLRPDLVTGADAADMQTAALLTDGTRLGVAVAAVLIVAVGSHGHLGRRGC